MQTPCKPASDVCGQRAYGVCMAKTPGVLLVPSAESVVAFIDRVVTLDWPTGIEDLGDYFPRLGLHPAAGHSRDFDSPEVLRGDLRSPDLAASAASWMSYKGELFSINLFLYEDSSPSGAAAVTAYPSIYERLQARYGPPADATALPSGLASSLWKVSDTGIEMYCHIDPAPTLQLGLSHIARNAAYEARPTS
jgi:hypothetical protein